MADLDALTPRQREIYNFIRGKIQGRGYGPTVREIGLHFRDQEPQRRHVPFEGTSEEGADPSRTEHVAGDPVAGRPGERASHGPEARRPHRRRPADRGRRAARRAHIQRVDRAGRQVRPARSPATR